MGHGMWGLVKRKRVFRGNKDSLACVFGQSDQGLYCPLPVSIESRGPGEILRMRRMI